MAEIIDILSERGKTHGDWKVQACAATEIRNALERWNTRGLPPWQMEALLMVGFKISRILQGDANCREHWLDVAGYAMLVANHLKPSAVRVDQHRSLCGVCGEPFVAACDNDKCPHHQAGF